MQLSGWGRYPTIETQQYTASCVSDLGTHLQAGFAGVVYAMGRSYGDSALAPHTIATRRFHHLLEFDDSTGTVRCEAGVSLADLLDVFVPRGWFLPVSPGTKFVSVGGAIASDVHGKNHHHDGCFSDHVRRLTLMLGDGTLHACSRDEQPDLFRATCGGMGLTGVIVDADIALKPIRSAYIDETVIKARNLSEILELFEEHAQWPYSVAWIDCLATGKRLGRSLLMLGKHGEDGGLETGQKRPLSVPVDMPSCLLNRYTMSAFNALYYGKVLKRQQQRMVHYEPFFYPLDGFHHWNRLYGKNGFTQYQFVIPKAAGKEGLQTILSRITASKRGSFLAVLKLFGQANANYLSFPMQGYTLALDFKMAPGILDLLSELDQIVLDYGGRLYLAKDARMSEETFKRGYPQWKQFAHIRKQIGAESVFQSLQSARLGI